MFVLDTDLLTLAQRGRGEAADNLRRRMALRRPDEVATTVVCYEEQMRGWLAYAAKAKTVVQQVEAYRRLESHLDDFKRIPLLSFSEAAAVEFQRLRKAGMRIGTMDLRIGSIVLTGGDTLLSRNLRDFQKIPGLRVEDWSAA